MSISFTIPLEPNVLRTTARMLLDLAGDGLTYESAFTNTLDSVASAKPESNGFKDHYPTDAEPVAPTPTPTEHRVAPAPTDEVDKNGLPWDERIHASTGAKNQDGSWRYKRGVDKDVVRQVEAELRQAMVAGSEALDSAPGSPETPTPPAPTTSAETPAAPSAPVGPEVWPSDRSFGGIVRRITTEKVDQPTIQAACSEVGISGLPELPARPDLFDSFAQALSWEA